MKTFTNIVNEWKASSNSMQTIKDAIYFIYIIDGNCRSDIKIFDNEWPQFDDYKNNVYVNGELVELNNIGCTKQYEPGRYEVEIKDIDNVSNCQYMFYNCKQLISVPLFDTSDVTRMHRMFKGCKKLINVPLFNTNHVSSMYEMFDHCESLVSVPKFDTSKLQTAYCMFGECKNLKNVPLFDISNNTTITSMFYKCSQLSDKTIREWSKIYDFELGYSKLERNRR